MGTIPTDASKGFVSSRDASTLRSGELQEAIGCEYRVGSPHLYKQLGRTSTGAALGASVQAIAKLQYDGVADVLMAQAGGSIYESASSTSPAFTISTVTGRSTAAAASPQISGYQERWLLQNGVDANLVREPNGVTTLGGIAGNWRPNGMIAPTVAPTYAAVGSSSTAVRPTTATGTYQNTARAYDTDNTTYSEGTIGTTSTWTWTANFASANATLYIDHSAQGATSGGFGPANPKFDVVDTTAEDTSTLSVEYSIDNGTSWAGVASSPTFGRTTSTIAITTGTDIANKLKVRGTIAGTGVASHKIYDLRVTAGAGTPVTVTNDLWYAFSEVYIDSDGVAFESNPSPLTQVLASDVTGKYGATFTFAAASNTRTVSRYVYRSLDDPAGGYPFLYRIATVPVAQTTWVDDFTQPPATIPTDGNLIPFMIVTFPTGESVTYNTNDPPPLAKVAVPFAGSVTYVPAAVGLGHYLYYSLASTISVRGMEQVPFFQYLDFQSSRNDTISTVATTNGGKSLLVFFQNYTMLVNYLPQASDGVFDNRIKEYVSNNRGSSGRLTCTEFTLPAGQTLVGTVDALGLWVTNGVNQMDEWSRDLDWATDMAGVDLSIAELIDNTAKRRLELLYTDTEGNRKERHFFYGRLKEDGDGKPAPLITGPHPMKVRTKHYTQIGTGWVGFSGDSTATGKVFLEESGTSDAANGYDTNGTIPWQFTMADVYPEGLSRSHTLEQISPKWADGNNKTYTFNITAIRDKGSTATLTKTYNSGAQQGVYVHIYCDRYHLQIQDLTSTAASAFVGLETSWRDAGESRDR